MPKIVGKTSLRPLTPIVPLKKDYVYLMILFKQFSKLWLHSNEKLCSKHLKTLVQIKVCNIFNPFQNSKTYLICHYSLSTQKAVFLKYLLNRPAKNPFNGCNRYRDIQKQLLKRMNVLQIGFNSQSEYIYQ
jgi:hypothetical protein